VIEKISYNNHSEYFEKTNSVIERQSRAPALLFALHGKS
jgi:hypothetical protein